MLNAFCIQHTTGLPEHVLAATRWSSSTKIWKEDPPPVKEFGVALPEHLLTMYEIARFPVANP